MILEEHLETTVKVHDQQLHRRVDLLLRTGKLLVESLADTNRIVRNMKRTAAYLGIPEEKLHINVSFTMLMSWSEYDGHFGSQQAFLACD